MTTPQPAVEKAWSAFIEEHPSAADFSGNRVSFFAGFAAASASGDEE